MVPAYLQSSFLYTYLPIIYFFMSYKNMQNKQMFIIIGWHNFNILWMCDALVKGLISHYVSERFKSLYMQPIDKPRD